MRTQQNSAMKSVKSKSTYILVTLAMKMMILKLLILNPAIYYHFLSFFFKWHFSFYNEMKSTYMIIFYNFLNIFYFFKLNDINLHDHFLSFLNDTFRCSNKPSRFHLKMERDEKPSAVIVALLLVKKIRKREKGLCG